MNSVLATVKYVLPTVNSVLITVKYVLATVIVKSVLATVKSVLSTMKYSYYCFENTKQLYKTHEKMNKFKSV